MACTHPTLAAASGGTCPICPVEPELENEPRPRVPPRRKVIAEQCRRSLARFVREAWHVLEPGNPLAWTWHLQVICDHVQAVLEDVAKCKADPAYKPRCENLMINAPPRSAKSMIVMVFAVAWAWTRWPWRTFRCLSVNPAVAQRDSRFCRELIAHDWYRTTFDITWRVGGISDDGQQLADGVKQFDNTARGVRAASGLGAKIVGSGSDVILIDDPHDPDEVLSESKRKHVVERYDASIHNRVNDPNACARIGVMQRLHENDLAGHLLSSGLYRGLVIRQVAEKPPTNDNAPVLEGVHVPTFLGWIDERKPGELMFPERFGPGFVDKERRRLGSLRWAGQHQQNPAPGEGNLFKTSWWSTYDEPPATLDTITMSVDLNGKKTDDGSRAACEVWGRRSTKHYLLYVWADRPSFTESVAMLKKIADDITKMYRRVDACLIEDKANGPSCIETLKLDPEFTVPVIAVSPGSDSKTARATSVQPVVEAGDCALPRAAPWKDDFVHEHSVFPMGSTDDLVDCTSQYLLHSRGSLDAFKFNALSEL